MGPKQLTIFRKTSLDLTVGLVEDLEDLHEKVDDVQVELDGGHDVLLLGYTAHNHLNRYIYQIKVNLDGSQWPFSHSIPFD